MSCVSFSELADNESTTLFGVRNFGTSSVIGTTHVLAFVAERLHF